MGRPKLVSGGFCRRGHLLTEADIVFIPGRNSNTCGICRKEWVQGYRKSGRRSCSLPGYFWCGHEKALYTNSAGQCRLCAAERSRKRHRSTAEWRERQAERQRRDAEILAAWFAGETFSEIGSAHGVTRERIRQIVARSGGTTVRMLAADLQILSKAGVTFSTL